MSEIVVGKPLYGGNFVAGGGESLPYLLPGEKLRDGVVVASAAQRVSPGCIHFGVCGGCQYQHADYAAQVSIKQELLTELLIGAGLGSLPPVRAHSAAPWGYRNRVRLRLQDGRVGYSRRGSHEFLPITMCPIAAPLLWRAAEAIVSIAAAGSAAARWLARVEEVELFCTGDQAQMQAQFFLNGPPHGDGFTAICQALQLEVPELAGTGAELHPERSRRVRRTWSGAAWGAPGLAYTVAGRAYWVARGAFFQVNRFLVETLVELVSEGAGGELAWDLFAGVGLFSQPLTERFSRVVAVEGSATAAAALAGVARRVKKLEAVHAPAQAFLAARSLERERPELVVLDPPRAGLGTEGAALLARLGSARVVYVSCDPVTLARDLAVLARGGYGVEAVEMVDLFPQTFHIETVVRLRRP